jgi:hypothetical protein
VSTTSWLIAGTVTVTMGLLTWLLLASTWPTPSPKSARRRGQAELRADTAMGRHALIEEDDTEPIGGRHRLGSPNATVSVAVLLADALHEQRARQRAWPTEDRDDVVTSHADDEFPTVVLPVMWPKEVDTTGRDANAPQQ